MGTARDAEKQRRRAEALRANLKRRKAAREGRETAGERANAAEHTAAKSTEPMAPGSIEGD